MSNKDNDSLFISITDDDGNDFELEHIDTAEFEGKLYTLFLPADMSEDDPDYGFIILEVLEEADSGEQYFGTVDDEELLTRVYDMFMDELFDEEEE